MAKITLDLTGSAGLASKFMGDLNDTTAQPQLRYIAEAGQVADGIYDPLRVEGYMSPANNTYTALTGTITDEYIAKVYSASQNTVYLAEKGVNMGTLSGLDDTSVTETAFFTENSRFRDLRQYEINDQEAIFYPWIKDTPTTSSVPNVYLGYKAVNPARGAFQIASVVSETLSIDEQYGELIASTGYQALGEEFSTGDFFTGNQAPVTGLRVRLNMPYVGTTQSWTLQVGIQTDSASAPSGTFVTGAVVNIDPNDLPQGDYDYVYVTFNDTVYLDPGTVYHIVVQPQTYGALGANEGVYWLRSDGGNSLYTDGRAEVNNGSWSNTSTSESFDFAIILNRWDYVGDTERDTSIQFDSAGQGSATSATTLTYTHTTTHDDNPGMFIFFAINTTSDHATGVTVDGVAATFLQKVADASNYYYAYSITGVGAGAHSIVITLSNAHNIDAISNAYYGVSQTAMVNYSSFLTKTSSGTYNIGTFTTGGEIWVDFIATPGAVSTGTVNATQRGTNSSNTAIKTFDSGTPSPDGSFNQTWTCTPDATWRNCFILVNPALASSLPNVPGLTEGDDESIFLHPAQNGFLYLFTNNRVHKFDGGLTGTSYVDGINLDSGLQTPGILSPDVLLFPSYMRTVDCVDYNSMAYIAIESSDASEPDTRTFPANICGVYSWDYQSILSTIRNFQPCPGARNIKRIFLNNDGDIRLITVNNNRFTEVRGLVNGNFEVLFTLGVDAYPIYRDALDYLDNMVVWLGKDGNTYALGKATKGGKEGIFKIGTISGLKGSADSITSDIIVTGFNLASQQRDGILVAYKTTDDDVDTNKLARWYPHGTGTIDTVAQKPNAGGVFSTVLMFPTLAKVNYIRVFHAPVGSSGTTVKGTIATYVNQSTTPARTDNVTALLIKKGYQYVKLGQALTSAVFALQFQLNWTTSQTLDQNADWMPRFVEVDYDELTKLF